MNLPWDYVTLDEICAEIKADKVSSMSRFGDGEFYWIIGVPEFRSRSGHDTIPEGSEELRKSLLAFSSVFGPPERQAAVEERAGGGGGAGELRQTLFAQPKYRLAGPLFFRNYGTVERRLKWQAIEDWIRGNGLEHLRWCSNLLFVKGMIQAAKDRKVFPLLELLRTKTVVVVGPHWLRALPKAGAFEYAQIIEVPVKNCYYAKDRIRDDILAAHAALPKPIFFSLSCSYTANLLVHELYDTVGKDSWLMDVGSIWDPYVGVNQRGYHVDIMRHHGGLAL